MPEKKIRFGALQQLARERAYTLKRKGRLILWHRNDEPERVFSSSGVGGAWEDILLDFSLRITARNT